jgi:hypothetical protein
VEPEDHAAILYEIMAALADVQFAATAGEQQVFRKAPRLLDMPLRRRSRTGRGGRFRSTDVARTSGYAEEYRRTRR